ncbi:MAG: MFS transporter, partial [Gemmatimonadales bacterium]
AVGYLLAAVAYFLVFPRWGWRPLFFLGGLPALLALFIRVRVRESEVWQRTRHESWGTLGRALVTHWRLFLFITLLMAMMNMTSHGTQDLYPTFLERQWGFGPSSRALITALSMVGALTGGIVIGRWSDRIGRRRAIGIALAGALLMIPLWAFAPVTGWLVVGAFGIQFMVQGAWGVIPAHITELAPDGVRGFLPGFAYQCGVLLASTITWVQALFAARFSYSWTMALSAGVVFVGAAVVALAGPERIGIVYGAGKGRADPPERARAGG